MPNRKEWKSLRIWEPEEQDTPPHGGVDSSALSLHFSGIRSILLCILSCWIFFLAEPALVEASDRGVAHPSGEGSSALLARPGGWRSHYLAMDTLLSSIQGGFAGQAVMVTTPVLLHPPHRAGDFGRMAAEAQRTRLAQHGVRVIDRSLHREKLLGPREGTYELPASIRRAARQRQASAVLISRYHSQDGFHHVTTHLVAVTDGRILAALEYHVRQDPPAAPTR